MPGRSVPLITNQYYHIFNRGINKQPIFKGIRDYKRALEVLEFYIYNPQLRFSKYLLMSQERREDFWLNLKKENKKIVNLICFCFMPNHFHMLLQQNVDKGISTYTGNFQNSYTKYFNTKHRRSGPLLQGQFKAVRIEDENQLLHLSRYIHLNPYTGYVVNSFNQLENYRWSSFGNYLGKINTDMLEKEVILSQFTEVNKYKEFVYDQANYQRELDKIKHLTIEEI